MPDFLSGLLGGGGGGSSSKGNSQATSFLDLSRPGQSGDSTLLVVGLLVIGVLALVWLMKGR